jgi:hypothetical protein
VSAPRNSSTQTIGSERSSFADLEVGTDRQPAKQTIHTEWPYGQAGENAAEGKCNSAARRSLHIVVSEGGFQRE